LGKSYKGINQIELEVFYYSRVNLTKKYEEDAKSRVSAGLVGLG
jgi:hypothetical protein